MIYVYNSHVEDHTNEANTFDNLEEILNGENNSI